MIPFSSKVDQSTLALKDIPLMSAATFYRFMNGIFSTINDLVEQVGASSLLPCSLPLHLRTLSERSFGGSKQGRESGGLSDHTSLPMGM